MSPTYDLKEVSTHVDHEMARFLELHMEIKDPSRRYPPIVVHAMLTAYAAHVRNLLEFFYEKSPSGRYSNKDAKYGDFLPSGSRNRFAKRGYNQREKRIWDRASKQVSHLSKFRSGPTRRGEWHRLTDWANDHHRGAIVPKIKDAVKRISIYLDQTPGILQRFNRWEEAKKA